MINELIIHGPATFKEPTKLVTAKKVNLIYGLNGSGKSTICRFLRSPQEKKYSGCSILPALTAHLYVYNADFVRENFHELDNIKGIFSLSKENKEADMKIAQLKLERDNHLSEKNNLSADYNVASSKLAEARAIAEDNVWDIKKNYSGGDRVLEYCLEGVKGKKESLLNFLVSVQHFEKDPQFSIDDLKSEIQSISGQDAHSETPISTLSMDLDSIELNKIFQSPIIGSDHSIVSKLIEELSNSDWVRTGLNYVTVTDNSPTSCPFCQAPTITSTLISQINDFFDDSYQKLVADVQTALSDYDLAIEKLPIVDQLKVHMFSTNELLFNLERLRNNISDNRSKIISKIQSPKTVVSLERSMPLIQEVNSVIEAINQKVADYNEKLSNKSKTYTDVKSRFWSLMRWNYDQTIARYNKDQFDINQDMTSLSAKISSADALAIKCNDGIEVAQKGTVNVEEAITNINRSLIDLGIDEFSIVKHGENSYRLKRSGEQVENGFSTLSEGEKMMITLLYFCELCKGRQSETDTNDEKIVVFDDPISSLSHIYVFNVGQMIRSLFFHGDVGKQIFVFTHSLYFFYELTDPNHERRKANQALFRVLKSAGKSSIVEMKYEEIQNDYQAYWQIINDDTQHPALIANCMRNIVEYFFNFVSKKDFNNVFQSAALKDNKFQAFCRYVNRESHSLGQNIYDLKEFDYSSFKEGLRLVFEGSDYSEHYKQMCKI